ncbi:hypothetical protein QEN19_000701 [Hanseniaspora menglaensis]
MSLGGGTVGNDINNAISAIESHTEAVNINESLLEKQKDMMKEQQEIESLFMKNPNQKIKVTNIHFNQETLPFKDDTLFKYCEQTLGKVTNMEEFQLQAMILQEKLLANGLVQQMEILGISARLIDLGNLKPMPFTFSNHDNRIVVIEPELKFVPLKKFAAKTGSKVGNGEGDGYVQLQLRNFLNNGESLIVDLEKGTKTKNNIMIQLSRPINIWNKMSLTFLQNKRSWGDFLQYNMTNGKIEWSHNFAKLPSQGNIKESIKNTPWNFICSVEVAKLELQQQINDRFKLPLSIIKECRQYDKIQLQLNLTKDNRDNFITPHFGTLLKTTMQANYIPSFSKYWESIQFEAQKAHSFKFSDRLFSLIATFRIGSILQYDNDSDLPLLEKFQKGGPNDLRLFNTMGLGPKSSPIISEKNKSNKGIPFGGLHHISYGISAIYPFKLDSSFNWLLFINGGHLTNDAGSLLKTGHTLSCGVGISFIHPAARFELNFGLPLMQYKDDFSRGKVQYGLGVSFL